MSELPPLDGDFSRTFDDRLVARIRQRHSERVKSFQQSDERLTRVPAIAELMRQDAAAVAASLLANDVRPDQTLKKRTGFREVQRPTWLGSFLGIRRTVTDYIPIDTTIKAWRIRNEGHTERRAPTSAMDSGERHIYDTLGVLETGELFGAGKYARSDGTVIDTMLAPAEKIALEISDPQEQPIIVEWRKELMQLLDRI